MRRVETTGKITEYDLESGAFKGFIAQEGRVSMGLLFDFVGDSPWKLCFGKHYKGRTTGNESQNHHYFGHLQQIAIATGNDMDAIDDYVKYRAISLGYPFDIFHGKKLPWSETRCNTVQYAAAIEMTHLLAAEEGIILKEE